MAVLGLRFCARAFSSCGKRQAGTTLHRGAQASHYRGLSLRSTGSRRAGSVIVAHGPSCSVIVAHGPSCSAARGTFPDQGSNPYPLHWQADSQSLRHQGSPKVLFLIQFSAVSLYGVSSGKGGPLVTAFTMIWIVNSRVCINPNMLFHSATLKTKDTAPQIVTLHNPFQ